MSGDAIWIESTRGADDEPVCKIAWGGDWWYAGTGPVRQTAADLMSCAAYAEWIHLLITKLGLPPAVVEQVTVDLMKISGRAADHGNPDTALLYPASGKRRGKREPVVIVRSHGQDGILSPAEARAMALRWLEVAEATESDQLVSEALRATGGTEEQAAKLFGYLRELRARAATS